MKLTKEMLIDWIDRPPSNSDLDLINYIIGLQNNRDKAIDYLEKSKLNQLDTHCKYLYIDFDAEKIENIDELINILKGGNDE